MKTLSLLAVAATFAVLSFSSCKDNDGEQNEKDEKNEAPKEQVNLPASPPKAETVSLETLPASVEEYVTKNYPGYKMESAVSDPLCNHNEAVDVTVTKAGAPTYSLIFKLDGQFVQQEQDVDVSKAPATILAVVKEKYAGFVPAKQIEQLTLADKSTQYLLDLSKDNIAKEVIFDTKGNVICEN
ncbi:MAG: PepSY-like domain-containing protein [Verrucomicrobia bacterium]|nr:PepSY-like domain-containing protein [Verrucomicrobiota bacterium]